MKTPLITSNCLCNCKNDNQTADLIMPTDCNRLNTPFLGSKGFRFGRKTDETTKTTLNFLTIFEDI